MDSSLERKSKVGYLFQKEIVKISKHQQIGMSKCRPVQKQKRNPPQSITTYLVPFWLLKPYNLKWENGRCVTCSQTYFLTHASWKPQLCFPFCVPQLCFPFCVSHFCITQFFCLQVVPFYFLSLNELKMKPRALWFPYILRSLYHFQTILLSFAIS